MMEFENQMNSSYVSGDNNSDLDTLACLATSAGRMHNSEAAHNSVIRSTKEDLTQSQHYHDSYLSLPTSCESRGSMQRMIPSPSKKNEMKSPLPPPAEISPKSVEDVRLNDMKNYQFKTAAIKELVESYGGALPPMSTPNHPRNSIYQNLAESAVSVMNHLNPPSVITSEMYHNFSHEPNKSAFDIVSPRGNDSSSSPPTSSPAKESEPPKPVPTSESIPPPPTLVPLPPPPASLFGLDPAATASTNGGSLFETLVQESHKILIKQDSNEKKIQEKNFAETNYENLQHEAFRTNPNFIGLGDSIKIDRGSDHNEKKLVKKRKMKGVSVHNNSEIKRAHGGPPFNPGSSPPPSNTPESSLCVLHEHTLLKMATRGFWSGDRGPLQDVFRLTRVENSDLQYTMNEITEHCYNVVKCKLEGAGSEKEIMHRHMRSYVDEIDSYLERIYPVSSVAINIYLPTAADYGVATWHGIVPTGWSEYRRAVVIREVFEILYYFSTLLHGLPDYRSAFFDKEFPDTTLYPMVIVSNEPKRTFNPLEGIHSILGSESGQVKYSRAFEALWTRTVPHEPFLILDDMMQLKLREYLEKCPIECFSPPETAIIVVDNKKYKAREILGYFRRGVQFVDYPKETGRMIIDTVSTLKNFSLTGAVRKIPPGKISKLVHPDLHLENYTNAILQIGVVGSDLQNQTMERTKIRKRRLKIHSTDSNSNSETKNKKESSHNTKEEDPSTIKLEGIASFCGAFDKKLSGHLNFPYDDSATITRPFDLNLNTSAIQTTPPTNMEDAEVDEKNIKNTHHNHNINNNNNNNNNNTESVTKVKEDSEEVPTTFDFPPPVHRSIPPNLYTPDILSSMFFPPGTSGEMFSLHLMIDSYRRAAKYLLDTANHLELVARRGGSAAYKREPEDPAS